MATATGVCGKATITYDTHCAWLCWCGDSGCHWMLACPGDDGAVYIDGEGRMKNSDGQPTPGPPKLTVAGDIEGCVYALEKFWKRPISVPRALRGKKLRKTVTGTPEEMARALG